MNADQGSQYTGAGWITTFPKVGTKISMRGWSRYLDNIFIERLWWPLKREAAFLHEHTRCILKSHKTVLKTKATSRRLKIDCLGVLENQATLTIKFVKGPLIRVTDYQRWATLAPLTNKAHASNVRSAYEIGIGSS